MLLENAKQFPCDSCDKRFAIKSKLERHFNSVHLKSKPFRCDTCFKNFTSKENLVTHSKVVHDKKDSHKCDLCDKTFLSNRFMKYHKNMVHLKLKPYSCSECQMKFSLKHSLRKHMKSHEKITLEVSSNEANEHCENNEFRLEEADGDLFDKSDDIEVKQQNDVSILDQKFETVVSQTTEYYENYGRNEHSNSWDREIIELDEKIDLDCFFEKKIIIEEVIEKPSKKFKCESCDKSFNRPDSLVNHRVKHSEEKLFGCKICQKKFYDRIDLIRHERRSKKCISKAKLETDEIGD